MKKQYIPNILSISRGIAVLGIVWLFLTPLAWRFLAALVLLVYALVSDFVDGRLARHWGVHTPFGAFLDTFADKWLVMVLPLLLYPYGIINTPVLLITFLRDIGVDALHVYTLSQGVALKTPRIAKVKVALQMFSYCFAVTYLAWPGVYIMLVLANLSALVAMLSALGSFWVYVQQLHKHECGLD